jgi:hypothetical protein
MATDVEFLRELKKCYILCSDFKFPYKIVYSDRNHSFEEFYEFFTLQACFVLFLYCKYYFWYKDPENENDLQN